MVFFAVMCGLVQCNRDEYASAGRIVSFFLNAMMIAKNTKPLILYQDTKLVSIHMDLPSSSRSGYLVLYSTCDPNLSKFMT